MAFDAQRNILNHRPSDEAAASMDDLAAKMIEWTELVDALCPDSREKSLALTHAEQSIMWARAAIARDDWDQRGRPG